jgi:hypothetical protein
VTRARTLSAVAAIMSMGVLWLAAPHAALAADACGEARDALTQDDLADAERQLLALKEDGKTCADALLKAVKTRQRDAARLVAVGDALASDDTAGARAAYAQAVALDRRSPAVKKLGGLESPPAATACKPASALLRHGFVDRAKAAYLEQQEKGQACAKAGLAAVKQRAAAVTAMIAIGEDLRAADHPKSAKKVLTSATRLDRRSLAARKALASVDSPDVYKSAEKQGDKWLDRLGQIGTWIGAALAWLAALLVAMLAAAWLARLLQTLGHVLGMATYRFPPGRVPIVLAGLLGSLVAWWIWHDHDLLPARILAAALLVVTVLVLLVGLAFESQFTRLRGTLFRLLVRVEDFTHGDKAEADAKGLSAQLAAGIRGSTIATGNAVDTADATANTDAFNDLVAAVSKAGPGKIAGVLLSLARTLLPSRSAYVTGHVHANTGARCGLSLTIVEGRGHLIGAVTLWQDEYGPASSEPSEPALRAVTLAGATWVRYRLSEEYGLGLTVGASSQSWQSEAAYQAAAGSHGASVAAKQALYGSALGYDTKNRSALFDSAVLDLRTDDLDKAGNRLELVAADESKSLTSLWFRAVYQQAVLGLNKGWDQIEETPRRKTIEEAYCRLRDVLRGLLAEKGADSSEESDPERVSALRRLEGPALILMAGILLAAHETQGVVTPGEGWSDDWRTVLDNRLDAETSPYSTPPQLSAADLLACARSGDVVLSDRGRYNLACYQSRYASLDSTHKPADAATESLRQLKLALALKDPDLNAWAKADPGLKWVRTARPTEFRKLTAKAEDSELAGIHAIGAEFAARLEDEYGIAEPANLAGTTTGQREAIAAALGVSRLLVDRWAGLAELAALPRLAIEDVNRLDVARVRSLADLAGMNGDTLSGRLARASIRQDPPTKLPDPALVDLWVLEAANAP